MRNTMVKFVPFASLFLLVAAAYLPAVSGDFLWDDDRYVSANAMLLDLTGLLRIWFDPGATIQYYPLTFSTFWIEHHLWGLSPAGYHLVNIALHALNAMLLCVVLRRLAIPGAWLAAAVFAVHPVHVESVAWITERKNVLSGVFLFTASLTYLRFSGIGTPNPNTGHGRRWYTASLTLYVLALLSKSVACTLPPVLLILVIWKRQRFAWRDFRPLIPFFLLGASMAIVTAWVERTHVGAVGQPWTLSPVERGLLAGRVTWFYLYKLVWPATITFVYPRWSIDTSIWWQYLFPVGAITALAMLWQVRGRLGKGPFIAALYYLLTLAPAMGFISIYYMQYSYVADHFQYLASIGPIAALAALLTWITDPKSASPLRATPAPPPVLRTAVCGVLLVTLAILTWRQAHAYRSIETLWRDTLSKNPDAWMAHLNLAVFLEEQGQRAEAMIHFEEALKQRPGDADVHHNYARALADRGQIDEAITHNLRATELDPHAVMAFNNLGNIYAKRGQFDEALSWYQKAIKANPAVPHGFYNAALLLIRNGQYEQAVTYGMEAAKLDPGNPETRTNLGHALIQLNRHAEAIAHLREALRINPAYPAAHANLALGLLQTGEGAKAIEHFQEALRTLPNDPMLRYYFGLAMGQSGQAAQSIEQLLAAWRLKSDSPEILNALAWRLATTDSPRPPDCPDPLSLAEHACSLTHHQQPMLLDTLAAAYANDGRFADAVRTAEKAIQLAQAAGQRSLATECSHRLETYQAGRPYREPATITPDPRTSTSLPPKPDKAR